MENKNAFVEVVAKLMLIQASQKCSLCQFCDLYLHWGCMLAEVIPTDKVEVGFKDLDAAILVGSMPRKEGMERKDLLKANVAIFKTQGAALDKYAKKTVKVSSGEDWGGGGV